MVVTTGISLQIALEATELDQADLVSQMAERVGLQFWATLIALVAAITAIVIVLT